jgi:hypothetical protein
MERILYLKQTVFEATAYTISGLKDIFSLRNEIDKLALKHLFSIESYRKAVRDILPLKNKIPIYFSSKLFLFYLRSNDKSLYYINFYEILKICFTKNIIIIFKNGEKLELEISKEIVNRELKKIKIISNYLNNLL